MKRVAKVRARTVTMEGGTQSHVARNVRFKRASLISPGLGALPQKLLAGKPTFVRILGRFAPLRDCSGEEQITRHTLEGGRIREHASW